MLLAEKVVLVYILNEFVEQDQLDVDDQIIDKRYSELMVDFINTQLVHKGLVDVCFDKDRFLFQMNAKGKALYSQQVKDIF